MSVVALNLLDAHRRCRGLCVGFAFQTGWYYKGTAKAVGLSHRFVCEVAFEHLRSMGLLEVRAKATRGREGGQGETTRVGGTQQLWDRLCPARPPHFWQIGRARKPDQIVHRGPKKEGNSEVPFEETELTRIARENLRTINATLLRHLIDLRVPNSVFRRLEDGCFRPITCHSQHEQQASGGGSDLGRVVLHRVFNNASLSIPGAAPEGGRFYGGWWMEIPSELRPHITIDGEETAEIDFSAMQPSLAYHSLGLQPPEEPYEVPGIRMSRDAADVAGRGEGGAGGPPERQEAADQTAAGLRPGRG